MYEEDEKVVSIIEKFKELAVLTSKLEEAQAAAKLARNNETALLNEVNDMQKEIDAELKKMKENSPSGTDWYNTPRTKF